jgi:hypothetical protein
MKLKLETPMTRSCLVRLFIGRPEATTEIAIRWFRIDTYHWFYAGHIDTIFGIQEWK